MHKMQNWKKSHKTCNQKKLMHEMQNFENINAEFAFFPTDLRIPAVCFTLFLDNTHYTGPSHHKILTTHTSDIVWVDVCSFCLPGRMTCTLKKYIWWPSRPKHICLLKLLLRVIPNIKLLCKFLILWHCSCYNAKVRHSIYWWFFIISFYTFQTAIDLYLQLPITSLSWR